MCRGRYVEVWRQGSGPSSHETCSLNPAMPPTSCEMSDHLGHIIRDLQCPCQPSAGGLGPSAMNPAPKQKS